MEFERACSRNGLIIDTNLLILLLVGYYRVDFIKDCTRTSGYTKADFQYLVAIIRQYQPRIIVTPHILSELSNLTFTKMISGAAFSLYYQEVRALITLSKEEHINKDDILRNDRLLASFGFADLSVLEAAKRLECAVITDDNKFYPQLLKAGCAALNLNDARVMATG